MEVGKYDMKLNLKLESFGINKIKAAKDPKAIK